MNYLHVYKTFLEHFYANTLSYLNEILFNWFDMQPSYYLFEAANIFECTINFHLKQKALRLLICRSFIDKRGIRIRTSIGKTQKLGHIRKKTKIKNICYALNFRYLHLFRQNTLKKYSQKTCID